MTQPQQPAQHPQPGPFPQQPDPHAKVEQDTAPFAGYGPTVQTSGPLHPYENSTESYVGTDGTSLQMGVEKSFFKGKQVGVNRSVEMKIPPAVGIAVILGLLVVVGLVVWFLANR